MTASGWAKLKCGPPPKSAGFAPAAGLQRQKARRWRNLEVQPQSSFPSAQAREQRGSDSQQRAPLGNRRRKIVGHAHR